MTVDEALSAYRFADAAYNQSRSLADKAFAEAEKLGTDAKLLGIKLRTARDALDDALAAVGGPKRERY